jgi:hypothetical protein
LRRKPSASVVPLCIFRTHPCDNFRHLHDRVGRSAAPEPFFTSRLPPKPAPQPKPTPLPVNTRRHEGIAGTRLTANENARDCLLSLYSAPTPGHRSEPPSAASLAKLTAYAQPFALQDALLSQFIGSSSILKDTTLNDQRKALRPQQCWFIAFGPEQSGKSTILSLLVLDCSSQLVFPSNLLRITGEAVRTVCRVDSDCG